MSKETKETKEQEAQPIPIETLPIQQLNQLKKSVEEQYQWFTSNRDTLKMAKNRYQNAGECLEIFNKKNNEKSTLIPLTDSLYIPGKIKTNKVLIDIGVGYYAERNPEQAKGYYDRKVKFVEKRIKEIQLKIDDTENSLKQINMVFQQKIQQSLKQKNNNNDNINNQDQNSSEAFKSLKSSGIL